MSISEQVKQIRQYVKDYRHPLHNQGVEIYGTDKILEQAADTIESLYVKLEGKKLIEEMAEEIENCYGRETELTKKARNYLANMEATECQKAFCEPEYLGENVVIGCRDGKCSCGNIVRSYQNYCDSCGIKLEWGNVWKQAKEKKEEK